MKDQTTIYALIIGIVVAFAAGYLVGATGRREPEFPVNYNPALAAESVGIKAAQDSTKMCFDLLSSHLDRLKSNEQPAQGPAH